MRLKRYVSNHCHGTDVCKRIARKTKYGRIRNENIREITQQETRIKLKNELLWSLRIIIETRKTRKKGMENLNERIEELETSREKMKWEMITVPVPQEVEECIKKAT